MLGNIGKYFLMMKVVFTKPKKWLIFWRLLFNEIQLIGINSIPIVILMSSFMGGVIALQTASNMSSPLLPAYTVGYITQSSTILEFSPTIISLILAGKIGSNIASEIGTMRITEQIDALEIMGVNSLNHLVLPKIIAANNPIQGPCWEPINPPAQAPKIIIPSRPILTTPARSENNPPSPAKMIGTESNNAAETVPTLVNSVAPVINRIIDISNKR